MSLVQGRDYYIEDGKYVFTGYYLKNRGYCCTNGVGIAPIFVKSKDAMKLKKGITRWVFVFKGRVVKIPSLYNWWFFLSGLLANLNERNWWRDTCHDDRLCPVSFACWGGWFIVMPRAEVLSETDEVYYDFYDGLPRDNKPTNFGWYQGRLVMIDYGN